MTLITKLTEQKTLKAGIVRAAACGGLALGCAGLLMAWPAVAQDAVVGSVETGVRAFEAVVRVDTARVRSGPGENYYETTRLARGARVTVVGFKFDWLQVVPPAGSFSYVARQFVELAPDGKTGRITGDRVNIRAGSEFVASDTTVQMQAAAGTTVTVLGEQGQYYKIVPPAGAFVFIKRDLLEPVRDAGPTAQIIPAAPAATPPSATPPSATPAPSGPVAPTGGSTIVVGGSATQPGGEPVITPVAGGAGATVEQPAVRQPSAAELAAIKRQEEAEARYDKAEARLAEVSQLPLEDQPLPELIATYESLAADENLPGTLRLQSQRQAATLRSKTGTRDELLQLREMKARLAAQNSEFEKQQSEFARQQAEIASRMNVGISAFTAIGQVRSSRLSSEGRTLLRLVDPGTGFTLVYLQTADASYMEQLVGVRGDLTDDTTLGVKVVKVTSMVPVTASAVGTTSTANIMPPSLLPKAADNAQTQPTAP